MSIETVLTCPLGSKCEEIKDNKIHRCAWYTQLAGKDPLTGNDVDKWGCAMAWTPILMVENSMQQRNTKAAIESFRNEMVRSSLNQLPMNFAIPVSGNAILENL